MFCLGDACYEAKTATHECPYAQQVEYTLFNITNSEDFIAGSSAPQLQEVGPFTFSAIEVSQAVNFTTNMESVYKGFGIKQAFMQAHSCTDCDLDQKIIFLNKEYPNSSDPGVELVVEATVRAVVWAIARSSQELVYTLPSTPPHDNVLYSIPLSMNYKKLYTGWKDHKQAHHVSEYEGSEVLEPYGFDDGKVFGTEFDTKNSQVSCTSVLALFWLFIVIRRARIRALF